MTARVLLIDGDNATRQMYREFLRSVGFQVVAVADAHGAVAFALASRIEVVVTDATPRGAIDGIEVTRRLRNHDGNGRIPIVVLTAAGDDEGRAQATAVGCDAILDRRCEPAALAAEIRRLVAQRRGNTMEPTHDRPPVGA